MPLKIKSENREFFIYSVEQGEFYERIICHTPHKSISNKFIKEIITKTWSNAEEFKKLNKYEQNILFNFIYNVGLELYIQWVNDGKNLSLDKIIEMSNKLLCNGILGFFYK